MQIPAPSWSLAEILPSSTSSSSSSTAVSSSSLNPDQLVRLARLSLLHVEPGSATAARLQRDVASLLSFVRQLQKTEGKEGASSSSSLSSTTASTVAVDDTQAATRLAELRPDQVTEGGNAEATLAQARVREGPYFSVPKVVEE
jgi:Asp-tRNA(Asn)/Glu-tRNA(Gln) amidotransferase C subunit